MDSLLRLEYEFDLILARNGFSADRGRFEGPLPRGGQAEPLEIQTDAFGSAVRLRIGHKSFGIDIDQNGYSGRAENLPAGAGKRGLDAA